MKTRDLGYAIVGVLAAGLGGMVLSGCNTAPAAAASMDYSQSLNKYYEGRPLCVWNDNVKFPVEGASPDEVRQRGFKALVNSGLLVVTHASKGSSNAAESYDLSPEGRSALERDIFNKGAGNFCYGRRKVVSLDAARQNSRSTELVDFHYVVADPAAWASEYAIQRAFPQIAAELAGPHHAQATLLDTTEGWQVAGAPSVMPMDKRSPSSTVAASKKTPSRVKQGS